LIGAQLAGNRKSLLTVWETTEVVMIVGGRGFSADALISELVLDDL
jgi:hypothetical protein